jgi:FG-GAP-like repeat
VLHRDFPTCLPRRSRTPRLLAGPLILIGSLLLASNVDAAPSFSCPEGYTDYNAGTAGQVTATWDSPIVGRSGSNQVDLLTRSGYPRDCLDPGIVPASDLSNSGWGCLGQCVELTSRWLARYVNSDRADDIDSWILGDGGSGYCSCASGSGGCAGPAMPSLYEVHTAGDRTTPRIGDVLSYGGVHAAIVVHVWADGAGMHIETANQNQAFVNVEPWHGDHFNDEACLIHALNMPTFERPPQYHSDIDGDGRGDICARAASGVVCHLSTGSGFGPEIPGPAWSDASGWGSPRYFSTIQLPDIDGDGKADVCARAAKGIVCSKSTGSGFSGEIDGPAWSDDKGWGSIQRYGTIRFPDIDGDGKADVCGRDASGVQCFLSNGSGFPTSVTGPGWSDASGWDQAPYATTIQFGDLNGDGKEDICGRAAAGLECYLSDGKGFPTKFAAPAWSDASGWGRDYHYLTIQLVDINGDGKADICARGAAGITCAHSNGSGFDHEFAGPAWSNDKGWIEPRYYSTIRFLDLDGDQKLDVCGRASDGVHCALSTDSGFAPEFLGPAWSDGTGYVDAKHFTTLMPLDINQDGKSDLCIRAPGGVECVLSTGAGFGPTAPLGFFADSEGWGSLKYYGTLRAAGVAKRPAVVGADAGDDAGTTLEDASTTEGGDASTSGAEPNTASMHGGCGCRTGAENNRYTHPAWSLAIVLGVVGVRRKRHKA